LNDDVKEISEQLIKTYQEERGFEDEYNQLFIDPFGAKSGISASYYFEGYESGKMLERTREILHELGVIKINDFSAPEDHFGCLFDAMAYAINLRTSSNEKTCAIEELEKKLFTDIINPNIEFFMADIFNQKDCETYISIVAILHAFLGFERAHFNLDAPKEQMLSKVVDLGEYYKKKKKVNVESSTQGGCELG